MGNQRVIQSKTAEVNRQSNSAIALKPPFTTRPGVHPLLQLQRQIGNQAVSRLIQAKLKVGKPNDTYEQEADRVADTVMRMPDSQVQRQAEEEEKAQPKPLEGTIAPLVQRQAEENKQETAQTKPLAVEITPWVQRQAAEEKKEEPVQMLQRQVAEEKKEEPVQMLQRQVAEEKKEEPVQMLQRQVAEEKKEEPVQMLQRQVAEEKKEEPVQAKEGVDGTTDVTPELENRIQTMRRGGQSLSASNLAFFEPRFGYNFRNVRVHTDSQASEIALKLNAQAFTIGQDIFFSAGHYEPNTSKGQWLLAHELTHTVQQQPQPLSTAQGSVQASTKSAIARSSVPSLSLTNHRGAENTEIREKGRDRSSFLLHNHLQTDSRLLVQRQPLAVSSATPQIQRSVLDRVLNRVADWAANIPGFTLLTVILGRNPINGRSVERNATNVLRGFMGLIPGGDLLFRGLQASGVIDRVFAWVNQQLGQFNLTPGTILERFRRVDLSASDIFHPWDAIDRFRNIFLNPTLNSIRAFASTFGSRVIAFIKEAILIPVGQFARRIPLYPLLTVLLGKDPITGETVQRNATNVIHGILTIIPGGEQVFQNLQQSRVIERAFTWFNEQITRLNLTWSAIRQMFSRAWDSLSIRDIVSPVAAFERIGNVFAPLVQGIRTFAPAAIRKVAEFIFEGVLSLAGGLGQRVLGIVRRAGGVISQIINNPIGFVGNLVGAVRRGFQQFSNNILTHLRAGLMGWLFGALQGAGLTLPERFDLRGIVSIVMQVLGLTYARLRAILVRLLGEERVSRAEQVFDFLVTIATQGLFAAWERIVEFAGNLQEMVIGGIRDWVARTVVGQAIARLVTLFNPAGAVIQAIMAIYNTVVFFIERAQQIAALAEAVFGSIASIAAGNISAAASYVERTMARTIPVVLSFLARFIGLGNVSEQIQNVIRRIQAPIENAMNRVADWIATQVRRLLSGGDRGQASTRGQILSDNRTLVQKEHDLNEAIRQARSLFRSPHATPAMGQSQLSRLKEQYRLTKLELRPKQGLTFQIHGEVNPSEDEDVTFKIHQDNIVIDEPQITNNRMNVSVFARVDTAEAPRRELLGLVEVSLTIDNPLDRDFLVLPTEFARNAQFEPANLSVRDIIVEISRETLERVKRASSGTVEQEVRPEDIFTRITRQPNRLSVAMYARVGRQEIWWGQGELNLDTETGSLLLGALERRIIYAQESSRLRWVGGGRFTAIATNLLERAFEAERGRELPAIDATLSVDNQSTFQNEFFRLKSSNPASSDENVAEAAFRETPLYKGRRLTPYKKFTVTISQPSSRPGTSIVVPGSITALSERAEAISIRVVNRMR